MWAARKKASGAVRSRVRPSSRWRLNSAGAAVGRIRLRRVKDVSAESLLAFLQEAVEPGATIHTDGWRGYAGLPAAGYRHQVTVISGGSEPAHEVMPRVHKVAALLKRWLLGNSPGRHPAPTSRRLPRGVTDLYRCALISLYLRDNFFSAQTEVEKHLVQNWFALRLPFHIWPELHLACEAMECTPFYQRTSFISTVTDDPVRSSMRNGSVSLRFSASLRPNGELIPAAIVIRFFESF